jgi:hypothetical protein
VEGRGARAEEPEDDDGEGEEEDPADGEREEAVQAGGRRRVGRVAVAPRAGRVVVAPRGERVRRRGVVVRRVIGERIRDAEGCGGEGAAAVGAGRQGRLRRWGWGRG